MVKATNMLSINSIKVCVGVIICSILTAACHQKTHKKITKAFYYWKTNFHLSDFEQQKLDSFDCKTLYVRFFDIDWNVETNEPQPVAVSRFNGAQNNTFSYIPVIFIEQEVLNKISIGGLEGFVKNFTNLLYEKCVQAKISPSEIQIDCDWTKNTKTKYFQLLSLCKKQPFFHGKTLSCTVRLHQLYYPQVSGLPPVDKGLLMCYNMGNLKLAGANNSILDLAVAKRYISNLQDYPLSLDVALPLFSWSLLYDNENRFTGILRGMAEKDLRNTELFEPAGKNLYRVRKDTLWQGYSLKRAEIIRHESCSPQDLYQLAELIAAKAQKVSTLIFYHLDSATVSKYNNNELEKIYHSFN